MVPDARLPTFFPSPLPSTPPTIHAISKSEDEPECKQHRQHEDDEQ
jgi:hypothetical protein